MRQKEKFWIGPPEYLFALVLLEVSSFFSSEN
jgi:hypothetical protein